MVLVMETVVLCHRRKESGWVVKEDKKWAHAPLARKKWRSRRVREMGNPKVSSSRNLLVGKENPGA